MLVSPSAMLLPALSPGLVASAAKSSVSAMRLENLYLVTAPLRCSSPESCSANRRSRRDQDMHTSSARRCCRRFPNRRDRKAEDRVQRCCSQADSNIRATERSTHNQVPMHRPSPTTDSNTMDSIPNRFPSQIPIQIRIRPSQSRSPSIRRRTRIRGRHTQIRDLQIQTQSDCPSTKRNRTATPEKTIRQRGRRTSCCRIAFQRMKLPKSNGQSKSICQTKLTGQMSSRLHGCSRNSTSRAKMKSPKISIQPSRD
jgi:hypothetical protein